jgi:hypothetical protein
LSITHELALVVFTEIVNGVAMPDNKTVCEPVPALSFNVSVAAYVPATLGPNLNATTHEAPAARVLPQVVCSLNRFAPAPLIASDRVSGTAPVFVTATACPRLTVPATVLGKVIEGTVGGVIVPAARLSPTEVSAVPVNVAAAGLTTPLLFTLRAAENVPAVLDVKVTVIEQLAPIARVVPQVLPVTTKSLWLVPLVDTPVIFRAAVPVFVNVAVCGAPVDNAARKLSDGVSDPSTTAPGLSAMKPVLTWLAIGVTTGEAAPTR